MLPSLNILENKMDALKELNELDEAVQNAFAELAEANPQMAIATACGMLVGFIEYIAQLQGIDPATEIKIDGNGESRSITIHAA
jgi:hypothetical protein